MKAVYEQRLQDYYTALRDMQKAIEQELHHMSSALNDLTDPGHKVVSQAETLIKANARLRGVVDVMESEV